MSHERISSINEQINTLKYDLRTCITALVVGGGVTAFGLYFFINGLVTKDTENIVDGGFLAGTGAIAGGAGLRELFLRRRAQKELETEIPLSS